MNSVQSGELPGAALPPPGIEVTKGGATKGRETQKKMRLVKTSRIFFCKERLKPIFLPETKNSRPQGRPPPASPAKRVAGGKEEQQNERALTFIKNRSKRYKACSDVEQGTGVEPAFSAWEADALPMY